MLPDKCPGCSSIYMFEKRVFNKVTRHYVCGSETERYFGESDHEFFLKCNLPADKSLIEEQIRNEKKRKNLEEIWSIVFV